MRVQPGIEMLLALFLISHVPLILKPFPGSLCNFVCDATRSDPDTGAEESVVRRWGPSKRRCGRVVQAAGR